MRPAAIAVLAAMTAVTASARQDGGRVPVVVELFTSEGCSSCPPADDVLGRLGREQPVAGALIIPLGLHVTYWDQLGWKDPAALQDATKRQQDYGRRFGEDSIYTPQAVVDGRDQMVGSDAGAITRAVAKAAKQPHARVSLTATAEGADTIVAHVTVTDVPADVKEKVRTIVFLTEDGLTSTVTRGENKGRTLHHDAVVRRLDQDTGVRRLSSTLALAHVPAAWRRDRLRVVAIVQGEASQRIVGAAITSIQ